MALAQATSLLQEMPFVLNSEDQEEAGREKKAGRGGEVMLWQRKLQGFVGLQEK